MGTILGRRWENWQPRTLLSCGFGNNLRKRVLLRFKRILKVVSFSRLCYLAFTEDFYKLLMALPILITKVSTWRWVVFTKSIRLFSYNVSNFNEVKICFFIWFSKSQNCLKHSKELLHFMYKFLTFNIRCEEFFVAADVNFLIPDL